MSDRGTRGRMVWGAGARALVFAGAVGASMLAGGCNVREQSLIDTSVGEATLDESYDQVWNNAWYTWNINRRSAVDDLGRIFLSDRPSRLSPGPIR